MVVSGGFALTNRTIYNYLPRYIYIGLVYYKLPPVHHFSNVTPYYLMAIKPLVYYCNQIIDVALSALCLCMTILV